MGKPEQSSSQAAVGDDVAPPPYTEEPTTSQSSISSNGNPSTIVSSAVPPYRPFPPVLYAHYQKKLVTSVFHLGNAENPRLYAVSVHTGWGGKGPGRPGTILHNGPTDKDPMFAAAGDENRPDSIFSPNSAITLPRLSTGVPSESCTEIMRSAKSHDTVVFRFSIEVQQNDRSLQREDFEWRKSKGDETKKVVDPPWKCGFKLVRLSHRPEKGTSSANGASQDVTSDGLEVVAVFFWNASWLLMDPFKIEFTGSGRTGALGDRFTLMAIITGLRLQWLKIQGRTRESRVSQGEARFVPGATG